MRRGAWNEYRVIWPGETMPGNRSDVRAGEVWMDPITIGAVLLAIVSGAGTQLGTQLWEGAVSLVRRPFRREAAGGAVAAVLSSGRRS
jgi:hypothetical protein